MGLSLRVGLKIVWNSVAGNRWRPEASPNGLLVRSLGVARPTDSKLTAEATTTISIERTLEIGPQTTTTRASKLR